jgi:hypothetical protein
MTPDDDTRALVRRAGDSLPVRPAPVEDLLRQGRGARRRRTRTTIGAVAAAVVVVTCGAVAVGSQLSNDATNSPSVSTPRPDPGTLTPPPGMRFVGRNGIAVAVPASWSTDKAWCNVASEDTVIVGDSPGFDCMTIPSPVSSVTLNSYLSAAGDTVKRLSASVDIDDIPVQRVTTYSYPYGERGANTMYAGALLSRGLDIAITVRSPDPKVVDDILRSAFAIPASYAAIPALTGGPTLHRHGFVIHHETRTRQKMPSGRLLGLNPPPGSIVARGSEVTVIRSTREPKPGCWASPVEVVSPTSSVRPGQGYGYLQLTIHVGETLTLKTIGPCGDAAFFAFKPTTVLRRLDSRGIAGAHVGTVTVSVRQPRCRGDIPCRGVMGQVGTVAVHVLR